MTTSQASFQAANDSRQAKAHSNLTTAELVEYALARGEGVLAANGALVVETGERTGRSTLDRFIVDEPSTSDLIDWGQVNRPIGPGVFDALWERVEDYLAGGDTFVSELHVGADPEYYLPIRVITQKAWHNLYGRNLFVRPENWNPKDKSEWTVLSAPDFVCDPQRDGTRSESTVMINFARRRVLLAGMRAPPNMGRDYAGQYEGLFERLADKHDVALYPFFLDGVAARPELNQGDGIHPNARGVAVIVERIAPYVLRALEQR